MKIAEINSTFLARDVYKRWQSAIKKAEIDITIFTPYFDNTLLRLLKANTTVEQNQVTIVTDITPENALEMPYQLRAAKKALSQRISVLSLQGLHAKVLLIDGIHASIGSQNFTGRGRKNKEASVLPITILGKSRFVETLQEWRLEAREVTEDEIDELLNQLKSFFRKHKKMHEAIQSEVNQVLARQAQKRDAVLREQEEKRTRTILLREHLQEIEQQSHVRLAQHFIYTTLRERNDYETLAVRNSDCDDLTKLVATKADGSKSQETLDRLAMYPIMFADSNRMGFARIGKGRITYIRSAVTWPNFQWVAGEFAKVSVTFPDTKTEWKNIVAEVTNAYIGSCRFGVSFNGQSFEIREKSFSKRESASQSDYDGFVENITKWLLDSKNALNEFFKKVLGPFRYSELGIGDKNAENYFEQYWYKTRLIQVQGNFVFVFEKC